MSCAAPPTGSGFLAATLSNLDCQAQTIGEAGYQALASPGSPLSLAITVLLAIFVAVIGLRFLAGKPLAVDEWLSAALKVGFVLALTASWPAYRTAVYDVVLKGPAEIAGSIGRASALPGSEGGLGTRLSGVDTGIMALVEAGSGRLDISSRRPEGTTAPPLADETALGWGKTLFVSSIIGCFGLLRLAGGLFLALAPLFAGFLLFEATRFLFLGWLRALIAVALGSVGIAIMLGAELAIIEPWLTQVLAMRAARIATLAAPFELLALTLAFALAMIGVLSLSARIAFAPNSVARVTAIIDQAERGVGMMERLTQRPAHTQTGRTVEQTRAQQIAEAVRQAQDRERGVGGVRTIGLAQSRGNQSSDTALGTFASNAVPLGRSYPAPSRRMNAQSLKRKPSV